MAGGDGTGSDPVAVPDDLAAVLDTDKRRAAYCAMVDTFRHDGQKSHVALRAEASYSIVHDIYDAMEDSGLVEQEGERRGATYSPTGTAIAIRDHLDTEHPGWTTDLEPFWEAAYETGMDDVLYDIVDSGKKQDALVALVTGIDMTDAAISRIAEGTELGYSGVNRLRTGLEDGGLVTSDGHARGRRYDLAGDADALRTVAAAHAPHMDPFDITGLPAEETDPAAIPQDRIDAYIADLFTVEIGDREPADGDGPDRPGTGYRDAARALVHAERAGADIAAVADRYGVDADALLAVERDVAASMLADGALAGGELADALNAAHADRLREADPDPEPDPVEETEVPETWTPDPATLRDLQDAPGLGTAGKRHVLAYLAEEGDADRDTIYAAVDQDNRELGQAIRFLAEDGLVAETGDGVELTDTGEALYDDPFAGDAAAVGRETIDLDMLTTVVAELRKGNTLSDVQDRAGVSYGTVKGRYDTFERLGFVDHSGPNWNRNYTVDDGALADAGVLGAVEERAADDLLAHGASQAADLVRFANTYDVAAHRFRDVWDADELPEDLIIPQWQEFLAVARASTREEGTIADATIWTGCSVNSLEDRLDRLPDDAVTLHAPDAETPKKERRVRVHPRFRDVLESFQDRLDFPAGAVTYAEPETEDQSPEPEPDGGRGGQDGPTWTDFHNRD